MNLSVDVLRAVEFPVFGTFGNNPQSFGVKVRTHASDYFDFADGAVIVYYERQCNSALNSVIFGRFGIFKNPVYEH